ncbi:hypothetical protein E2C01_093798 [Portunus trituberculatus]|uniref:Uncharacterized protein n=1 Tax=Portunus trituberculatus TaxID=210409 RepID=A0A5B7JZ40_PORTR|nr:hypothetical protein [Portunus trituberculatus]
MNWRNTLENPANHLCGLGKAFLRYFYGSRGRLTRILHY